MDNPPVDKEKDFLTITSAPKDISNILTTSCYDCHSNTTKYPWYANIAPVSWWMKHHIDEGKEHVNFSIWGDYPKKKADHKLEECVEYVEKGEMPMSSYTWTHGDAKLSEAQIKSLLEFFKGLGTGSSDEH